MSAINISGRSSAFNVQKILWFADELGLDYRHTEAGGRHGGLDAPEFIAMNPNALVPVLSDGELVVWESHAILRYLAAVYGAATFWPADPAARSHVDRWLDWGQTTFQPAFMRLFWGFYRQPAAQRDAPAIEAARARCEQCFDLLDRELAERQWLAGDDFSLADIPVATALFRYVEMGAGLTLAPNVDAWYERLAQRPAFRGRIIVDFSELAGRTDY